MFPFYTIFNTLPFLHTAPTGSPVELVGKFIRDKLFINVVQVLLATMLDPIIKEHDEEANIVFPKPPSIEEYALPVHIILERPVIIEE